MWLNLGCGVEFRDRRAGLGEIGDKLEFFGNWQVEFEGAEYFIRKKESKNLRIFFGGVPNRI